MWLRPSLFRLGLYRNPKLPLVFGINEFIVSPSLDLAVDVLTALWRIIPPFVKFGTLMH